MPYTLTSPRPSHGSLNWDATLENDLAGIASAINGGGWVINSAGITTPGNWTLNQTKYRVLNGVVALTASLTRNVSAISPANAAGIVPGITILTLPSALTPAQSNGVLHSVGVNSTIAAAGVVSATGVVIITNLAPSQGIPVGGVLDLIGTYLL